MGWIRKAPTSVVITAIIVGGLMPLAAIVGFVVLEISGSSTADYRGFLNLLMNGAILALSATGAVGGIAAARSASNAEDQTNGQLTAKEDELAALRRQVAALQNWKDGH